MVRSSFVVQSFILLFPLCALSAAVVEIAGPPHLHSAGRDPPPLVAVATFSGLDGARRGGGGEGGGRLLLPRSSRGRSGSRSSAAVFDIATGQRDGSGKARKRGTVDRPGAVSRLKINEIF